MTESYYYARTEEYRQILDRKKIGVHSVFSNDYAGYSVVGNCGIFFKARINVNVESL